MDPTIVLAATFFVAAILYASVGHAGASGYLAAMGLLGVARSGGMGATSSGDIFVAFATGNRGMPPTEQEPDGDGVLTVRGLTDRALDPLFEATVEATEEAIVNALVAAETMTGRDGITAHRLPHGRLVEVMQKYGRLRGNT